MFRTPDQLQTCVSFHLTLCQYAHREREEGGMEAGKVLFSDHEISNMSVQLVVLTAYTVVHRN